MVRYLVGDLLTGRRIQWLTPTEGEWSEVLNDAGALNCTVSLADPTNRNLGLFNSAAVGKAFLAAVEGDLVLQAGPIWTHHWNADDSLLTLNAAGMWSYFDHRALLPILAGISPTDAAADTRFWPIVSDPEADGYPWVSDTRTSLQGIARHLVEQAQAWTYGNVPVILPDAIAGTNERWYRGTDLAYVGERLKQLTAVDGGPDIMFTPRFTTDKLGIEWVMRIGTPTQPMLYSAQTQKFYVGIAASSISGFTVDVDGNALAAQGFAVGGRSLDQALIARSESTILPTAGYAQLDVVDSSHSTTSEESTLQQYSDEIVNAGSTPVKTFSFQHELAARPFLEAFNAGDFATVKVVDDPYIPDDTYSMRILARAGSIDNQKVGLTLGPEVN